MFWQKGFVCSLVFVYGTITFAQDTTNTTSSRLKKSYLFVYHIIHKDTYGKNIIKYNPISTALFSDPRNITFGYERTTWRNQSASINVGGFFIPRFISNDIGAIDVTPQKQVGYIITLDYRFYLHKLNTRPAPNGAYIGPFLSTYQNKGGVDFNYVDANNSSIVNYSAELNSKFSLYNLGFQFGYQFIFGKRISLDLILLGPAISYYRAELELKSNLSPNQTDEFYQKYYDKFFSKIPFLDELISRGNFKKNAFSTGFLPNYRFAIQFGYHF